GAEQNLFEILDLELIEHGHDRQAADELRDHAEADQILRRHAAHHLVRREIVVLGVDMESERALAEAFLDDLVEAHKRAAANEENVRRVDLNVFLVRMLAAALWGNVASRAFENFEQRLLHAFAGNVA